MTSSPSEQGRGPLPDRLAAAARALAAAEQAARRPTPPASTGASRPRKRLSAVPDHTATAADEPVESAGPTAADEAARRWVDGLADPADAGLADSTHLDLSSLKGGDGGGPNGAPTPAPLDAEGARQVVLRQLTMGPRTRQQLEDRLRLKHCPDDVAAEVLDRMTAVGLVDDQAYAQMLVRSKQTGRGLAKRALAQELRQKGVDDEVVSQALGSIDPESERARAEELAAKKMRTMSGLDPQAQSRRLSGMLARKGYPPSVVYAVVRDAVNGAPEHQRD